MRGKVVAGFQPDTNEFKALIIRGLAKVQGTCFAKAFALLFDT